MPNVGLRSKDGTIRRTWAQVGEDLLTGAIQWADPCDPAMLAFLIEESTSRGDVDPEEVSASQIEKGTRELYLSAITDYFVEPVSQIASILGTMKHAMINRERPGFVTETRLAFEENGIKFGSAKCDTFYVPHGKLVDLKNIGWYKVKLMLQLGPLAAAKGYAYQLNLFRVLMGMPENQAILFSKYPWLKPSDLEVKIMQLTCAPPDVKGPNKKEALKFLDEPRVIPIMVPFIDDSTVLDAYRRKYYELQDAHATGTAELCSKEERWEKDFGYPTKCAEFCPVANECRAMSDARSELHPLEEWEAIKNRRAQSSSPKAPNSKPRKALARAS